MFRNNPELAQMSCLMLFRYIRIIIGRGCHFKKLPWAIIFLIVVNIKQKFRKFPKGATPNAIILCITSFCNIFKTLKLKHPIVQETYFRTLVRTNEYNRNNLFIITTNKMYHRMVWTIEKK